MKFLFIHQNFPGQFRFIAKELADNPDNQVYALGETRLVAAKADIHPRIVLTGYQLETKEAKGHPYVREYESHIRRGQQVFLALQSLHAKTGFYPDVIFVHCGWGEGLFLKDVYPQARIVTYAEYFHNGEGPLIGFDPEFPANRDTRLIARIRSSGQLVLLAQSDAAISPTEWQKSQYPEAFRDRISVIHEGVDTNFFKPDPQSELEINGQMLRHGDQIVTYVARGLEQYRGFHVFMRALPAMQSLLPNARFVIAGGDDVHYGRKPENGMNNREQLRAELGDKVNWDNVLFTGFLPYNAYRKLLQVSAAHVYLTYPFVLSWSMLDAMASGCHVIASDTGPVQEVIKDGMNGNLVGFFDTDALAAQVAKAVTTGPDSKIRANARQTILDRYDRERICLPAMRGFLATL